MRAAERCHVRDCPAREWTAQTQQQQQQGTGADGTVVPSMPMANGGNVVFRVPGDMRFLNVVLSAIARRFRNRKNNFMCKAHFLPEDLLLTGSGISLSKRAVPCFQVPRKTLKMVVRNGVSAKHSEVACALLERSRGTTYLLASHDSSSDSDVPSGGDCCGTGGLECHGNAPSVPPICHPGLPQYLHASAMPEATLTQRLQFSGICQNKVTSGLNVKRSSANFISRDDGMAGDSLVDYKRLKLSDSDSPPSQGHGDVASDASGANSRAGLFSTDEVADEGDDMEDESKDMDEQISEERLDSSLDVGSAAEPATPPYPTLRTLNSPLKGLIIGQETSPALTTANATGPTSANPATTPPI
ncbi:uncharacterized protein LOC111259489 isoform X2 [Varroa jacobsoni]|uniref:Uncharacterized protein n=1 Tax=Varroa destructor TaxID=109461 RepID=A0A7M7KGA7_VARDE|nr:uncharacterized protein LOC111252516 isoform X2 [Varroa destructor]XP_022687292.1 uncharacterized protein LOC111259489 isoform X2 [Varroa jacobsoni]